MNLTEIEQRVKDELQYAPEVTAFARDIRRVLTAEYTSLCEMHEWPFLLRQKPMWMLPDLTIANADVTGTTGSTNAYGLRITKAVLRGEGLWADTSDADFENWLRLLIGSEVALASPALRTAGADNWWEAPFLIDNLSSGESTSTPATPVFYLDPHAKLASGWSSVYGDLTIKTRRYRLPPDCAALQRVVDVEAASPLVSVSSDEAAYLPDDSTGSRPTHFAPDGGFVPRMPVMTIREVATKANNSNAATSAPELRNEQAFARYNEPPYFQPTVTAGASGTGDTLAAGTYRIAVAWSYGNRHSQLTVPVEGTVDGSTTTKLTLSALPSTNGARDLSVWIAKSTGPFYLSGFVAPGTTTFTIALFPTDGTALGASNWRLRRWDEEYPGGSYQYIRVWPRPTAVRQMRLDYLARPRHLLADTDEPEFHHGHHELLVWKAVEHFATRHNSTALKDRARAKVREELGKLMARYGMDNRSRIVKGVSAAGPTYTTPTLNWQG